MQGILFDIMAETGDFIIVMQYANDGSLRILNENEIRHGWQWKLNLFYYLAQDKYNS